ncbi:MAG: hypothetical protein EOO85_11380 [Pedobacter sp.]|nr:MAG: hypothetical protein EOO85_11380 [Pedobacter sp.]
MNNISSINQTPLREKLTEFLSQHPITKAGKHYKGSYLYNPKGYHFIDLYRFEKEDTATIMVINESQHVYKIKAKYGTSRRYEVELVTIQEVLEFIDNFAWQNFPDQSKIH